MTDASFSAELVDKIGVATFYAMSTLIVFCIAIGMFAVYTKYNQPNWADACIAAGGVPLQVGKQSYDCKKI